MTVIELVEDACARLEKAGVCFGHGTTNAFDEAAWLVLWRLALPLDALDDNAEREVTAAEHAAADALVEQRIRTRQPAAYLTGEAWLQGVPFHVDERTIVPRSLVAEVLAEGLIDDWMGGEPQRVLDLCTGNGSLAVLAAMAWPDARVHASDLSADALAVAARNVTRHGLDARIRLRQGADLHAAEGTYDLVLCNPPYVNARAMAALPPEFLAEPEIALAGGEDGMDFLRRVLPLLPTVMTPAGVLVLEIGHEQAHFEAAFPRLDVVWLPTSAGDAQVVLVTREALVAGAKPPPPRPR